MLFQQPLGPAMLTSSMFQFIWRFFFHKHLKISTIPESWERFYSSVVQIYVENSSENVYALNSLNDRLIFFFFLNTFYVAFVILKKCELCVSSTQNTQQSGFGWHECCDVPPSSGHIRNSRMTIWMPYCLN